MLYLHRLPCLLFGLLLLGCHDKSKETDSDATATDPTGATESSGSSETDQPTSTSTATTSTSTTSTSTTDTSSGSTSEPGTVSDTEPPEPGGVNPCGTCRAGQFCRWFDSDIPACGSTECVETDDPTCMVCFAAPAQCPTTTVEKCAANVCFDGGTNGFHLAEDGIIVVECDIFADTGCGP
ncbi:hypothetical protein [Nannocystis bainbridge]|uniref:Uncharacterized protein n=1 Tax=Nannocystis bainbridge TaxID=2995303 RepID=A0ABT5E6H2_9BACT|nr:hypothetical protein [Nannocystis bainbridge]MDC0721462.1 hypothetical protein [Nannocystis bainbridge]